MRKNSLQMVGWHLKTQRIYTAQRTMSWGKCYR